MNKIIKVKRVFSYKASNGKNRMHLEASSNYSKRVIVRDYADRPYSFEIITKFYEERV